MKRSQPDLSKADLRTGGRGGGLQASFTKVPISTEFKHTPLIGLFVLKSYILLQWIKWYVYSVAQSCPTLCNPMDCSPPGSSFHGIPQARILEQVAISYSRGSSWPRDRTPTSGISCSAGRFFTTEPHGKPQLDGVPPSQPPSPSQKKRSTWNQWM